MPQISEKWEIQVGKNKHIVSGQEKDLILMAREKGLSFVKFRDLVINPAFVMDVVLVERVIEDQLEAPFEDEFTEEQLALNERRKQELKAKYPFLVKKMTP